MRKNKSLRKKHRIKRKKALLENNIVSGVFLFFFFLCGAVYLFVFHPLFQVESITIINAKNLREETLHDFIEERLQIKFFFFEARSIFLMPGEEIRNEILGRTSVIKNISIKRVFPAELKVEIEERQPFAIWCGSADIKNCYYVDKEGIVFQKVNNVSKRFLLFVKEETAFPGKKIIEVEHLGAISLAREEFLKMGVSANYFHLPTEKTIKVFTVDGWKAYFSVDKINRELENLGITLGEISESERKKLDYIDLRFGDRIYYK